MEVSWVVERREVLLSWSRSFILDIHTTFGWTWDRRAREPVEVSWARDYFLVGWEVNPVGSVKRSVQ